MNEKQIIEQLITIINDYRTSKYKPGDISLVTGLQKQADGTWAQPSGKQADRKSNLKRKTTTTTQTPKTTRTIDYRSNSYDKYVKSGKVDKDTYDKILAMDPTKEKKYIDKLLSFFHDHNKKLEDIKEFMIHLQRLAGLGIIDKDAALKSDNMDQVLSGLKQLKDVGKEDNIRINHDSQNLISTVYNQNGIMITTPNIQVTACIQTMGYEWCLPANGSTKYQAYTNKFMIKPYYILDKSASEENELQRVVGLVYPDGEIELYTSTYNPVDFNSYIEDTQIDISVFKPVSLRDINTLLTKKQN